MKKIFNAVFKTTKAKVIAIAVLSVIVIGALAFPFLYEKTEKVDTNMLLATLEEASELTTAKFNYTGVTKYKDSGVKFLTKADFTMVYKATARIGIDVKEVEITADDAQKVVYIKIPKAEVLDVKVDASSIQYFSESFSLFNPDEKEDGNKAIALAEKEAKKEVESMGGLEMADNQAETLIRGILSNALPRDYRIEVKQK